MLEKQVFRDVIRVSFICSHLSWTARAKFTTVYKLNEIILPFISWSFALIPKQLGCLAFDLRDVNDSVLEIYHRQRQL